MPEGRSTSVSSKRRAGRVRGMLVLLLLLVLGVLGFVGGRASLSARANEQTVDDNGVVSEPGTTIARRGPLSLVLTQRGTLDCVRKTTLYSKVEWETKITYLLPEGSFVKKGDLIAELDVAKLREEYGDEQVDVMTAEKDLAAAEDALLLQRIENENLLADAKLKKELADLSLEGYKAAEYPYQVRDLERQIAAAADALHTAEEKVEYTTRLFAKGYKQAIDLDRDRLALSQARQKHSDLAEQLRVLEKHNHERTLRSLEGGAYSADRSLTRAESMAEQKLLLRQMMIDAQRRRLLRQKQQFRWATQMLEECKIVAPHDGQVVYAPQRDSYEPIGEGSRVRFLQPIAVIPDRSQMQVAVRIHETQRRLLSPGLPAEIRTDADPRRVLRGTVAAISQFPLTGRFPNYDLREYEVTVHLEPGQDDLTPGLTSKVDLIAASKPDALQVPFDAVTEVDDAYLVFVRHGENVIAREVVLGERSQDHVEVLSGLDEGERVVLDPRVRCNDVLIAWERSRHPDLQSATAIGE
jgi:HlyD family secretion protein